MFKSHKIESNNRVLRKNKVDTYVAPVFAPDYGATVLAAKMCIAPMSILCILVFYEQLFKVDTSVVSCCTVW